MIEGIQQQIEKGIAVLRRGGLVAYPTDTVYGLGAAMDNPQAVARIFQVKQRSPGMPLPLLLGEISDVYRLASEIPPFARRLIDHFWPGALTIVLFRSSLVPDYITAGGPKVGVRLPAHPVPVALSRGLGVPIVGTSANLSGRPSALMAEEVRIQLGNKVDLIIDGGRCPGGTESTVIDVTGLKPVTVREGAISKAEIERILE